MQERKLRAYSRDSSPAVVDAVKYAFERWVSKMWNDKVVTSTPLRSFQMGAKCAATTSQTQIPRQQLRESAVHLSLDNSSEMRMEKKRKIQLDSIPE